MFSAEGLLEEVFGYNFFQEVQAQGLIGVSARAAQPQGVAASYQGNCNLHAVFHTSLRRHKWEILEGETYKC